MKRLLETSVIIEAPATVVWRMITDTLTWPEWGPSVRAVRCQERWITEGAAGYVQTAVGLWLPFEVTRFIPQKEWSWRVGRIKATGHRVEPLGKDRCRLAFGVPVFAAPYLIVCAVAGRRIKKLAEEVYKTP